MGGGCGGGVHVGCGARFRVKRWGEGEGVVIHCKWHLRIWILVVC